VVRPGAVCDARRAKSLPRVVTLRPLLQRTAAWARRDLARVAMKPAWVARSQLSNRTFWGVTPDATVSS
ncbi:MAG: hypothetical protein JWO13_4096, partial [Acidobacteriales bacterium]|nr:hypothetical protein [Terriglobales bacterium]